ncbi:MAG: nucleotide pyrophosphatase [Thermoprotei archaeon]|nr:MAG: nucleotide pyrophosphatase [Thermoprotei archaeon]
MARVVVLGLDSAPPSILYNPKALNELPNLASLIEDGERYELVSCHPPITIPAWAVMVTGRTPGELGLYGFRHRKPGSYNEFYIASSYSVKAPTIWDLVGQRGGKSIVVGVPPTYPPKPVEGWLITDFVTPSKANYTWPPELKAEVEGLVGDYIFDAEFRTLDRDRIIRDLWAMTRQHFKVFRHLLKSKPWDFAMMVEIGVDRVQHAFWGYSDPSHRKYEPGNPYEHVIIDYYKLLDEEVGELLKAIPRDTVIVVASDHGAKAMKGAFCINQWLAEQGYLKLEEKPNKPGTDLAKVKVDWSKTIAWGWGGYYARVFLNVKDREPQGAIDPKDYEHYREHLAEDLRRIKGPKGETWNTKVYRPEELYPTCRGDKPDLIVYLDDLSWRSAGTLGWPSNYLPENDTGPDDAVHDWAGVFTVYNPRASRRRGLRRINIEEAFNVLVDL